MSGMVYLVGAGPGDAGLLTLRGAELLGRADVVIYDGLVNPALLRLAPPSAEIIFAGKLDRTRAVPQDTINHLLLEQARAGHCVVRLKGGDPYVLGRGGEEVARLVEAGIPFEVVPGVSSAVAAPNYAGIPLTHRDICSSFTVVTGHEDPAREQTRLDWSRLAQVPGTLVVLMGLKRLREITESLVKHGRLPGTPVALIRWGTTGRQSVLEGTLASIADIADQAQLKPPVVTVIGDVVSLRDRLNWFEHRPLFGQRIAVAQVEGRADPLCRRLEECGADVLRITGVDRIPSPGIQRLPEALVRLQEFDEIRFTEEGADWIVFAEAAAVGLFRSRFDLSALRQRFPQIRVATLSDEASDWVSSLGITPDLRAASPPPEWLVEALRKASANSLH